MLMMSAFPSAISTGVVFVAILAALLGAVAGCATATVAMLVLKLAVHWIRTKDGATLLHHVLMARDDTNTNTKAGSTIGKNASLNDSSAAWCMTPRVRQWLAESVIIPVGGARVVCAQTEGGLTPVHVAASQGTMASTCKCTLNPERLSSQRIPRR
jgi:hypothetical protein